MSVDLKARREELLDLQARLTSAADYLEHADENGGELSSAAGDQHLADHASEMLEREVDETLEENAEHVLREVEVALARIDAGTYGTCSACGQEIPEERLAAIPYATLCIEDKRKQERL
jgi:RNA polymerase-binding transcription factor DksA